MHTKKRTIKRNDGTVLTSSTLGGRACLIYTTDCHYTIPSANADRWFIVDNVNDPQRELTAAAINSKDVRVIIDVNSRKPIWSPDPSEMKTTHLKHWIAAMSTYAVQISNISDLLRSQ